MQKFIFWLYAVLLFLVPLILWPFTSEIFEFNKIILTYLITILICSFWALRMVYDKRIIFRRTILDIPLVVFLGTQIISTFISIDFYTSVFGYYSRFNGGLISTICYLLLYWAFVSNIAARQTVKLIKILLGSAFLVSVYAVLEHFGIDKDLWVQDVQSRVFSTLGQPNWLAAWVVALIPLTWVLALQNFEFRNSKSKYLSFIIYFLLFVLFFWTLIFTKSRSGFIGFIVADFVFWGLYFLQSKKEKLKQIIVGFTVFQLLIVGICLISGTQWTPSLNSLLNSAPNTPHATTISGTALETGGTESGSIRKIVWEGAVQIWRHYPILGTGVETFAFSYYLYRPLAHNLTSEWDFIYNKAHNQLLNLAANSGTLGLASYLIVIAASLYLFFSKSGKNKNSTQVQSPITINNALFAGFVSLSVSNFFGFSVVPTDLEFFLFPAFAVSLLTEDDGSKNKSGITNLNKALSLGIILVGGYLLITTYNYWRADTFYAQGKAQNSVSRPDLAAQLLVDAIKLSPNQAVYYSELGSSYSAIAMAYHENKETTQAAEFTNLAISQINTALSIAPANTNIRRQMFGILVRLSTINEDFLKDARDSLLETITMAPTDAKLYFNLGIANSNLGDDETALKNFEKAIELKPNYADARIQYAALLVHRQRYPEAKDQLNYVLTNIDPNNEIAKRALDNIR